MLVIVYFSALCKEADLAEIEAKVKASEVTDYSPGGNATANSLIRISRKNAAVEVCQIGLPIPMLRIRHTFF